VPVPLSQQSPPNTEPTEPTTGEPRPARSRLARIPTVAIWTVVAASFGVWIYAFSGLARSDPPDLLDDEAFAPAAEERCAAALDDLAELPGALDAIDGGDRADQVRSANARLEQMLDELDGLVGGTARDVEITSGWLADWRVLIDDRYGYAERIEGDPSAQFLITDTGVSERLDRRITRVADTNDMPSCAAPGDVG
jgi:hypothetical protein